MKNVHEFAGDVFRTVCTHLSGRAAALGRLIAADAPCEGWLEGEAYLACRSAGGRFAEVEFRPTYASEGIAASDGQLSADRGGLRVGGVGGPGHHLWLFAEFVRLPPGDGETPVQAAVSRLLSLGWKRSAAVLVVVATVSDDVEPDRVGIPAWDRPPLADAVPIALPDGGWVVVRAFDVKRNPADTIAAARFQSPS